MIKIIMTILIGFGLVASAIAFFLAKQAPVDEGSMEQQRHQMVENQIEKRGITDEYVLRAMRSVKRHKFVPLKQSLNAYDDRPLPIGQRQTISQPYIVALMTELAQVGEDSVVFEVGTGSGYQAAVLGEIVKEVYTVEYIEPLGLDAKKRLADLGYENVHVKTGDGYQGWPEHAPFDAILVTAGIDHVPKPLIEQLKPDGRIIIPVGADAFGQELLVITKDENGEPVAHASIPVRFVPFLGPKKPTEHKQE